MISIRLLGPMDVRSDGGDVALAVAKQRQILAILALAEGAPVSRERLADDLWEGSPPRSYVGTLDSYLCLLRGALRLKAGRSSALATTPAGFVLEVGHDVEVDLHWYRRLARMATEERGAIALDWAEEAVDLARGDLLADVPYAAWAVQARDRWRREHVDLCVHAARRAIGVGEFDRAARLAREALAHDAVSEAAGYQLVLALWFAGDRVQALAAYAGLRAALSEQLGEEPSPRTQELYLTVLRSAQVAPSPSAASESTDRRPQIGTLLRLLRQELELVPGVIVPARDALLSQTAASVLHPVAS